MTGYSKIKRAKLPKFPTGGYIEEDGEFIDKANAKVPFAKRNSAAIQGAGNFVASSLDTLLPQGNTSEWGVVGEAGKGAAAGAAAGTAILPGVGTVVGGVIGAGVGVVSGIGKRNKALEARATNRAMISNQARNNSNQILAQYDSNGVPTTLYANGGPIMGIDTPVVKSNIRPLNPLVVSGDKNLSAIMSQNLNGSLQIKSTPQGILPMSNKASNLSNIYVPSKFQQQGPDVPTQKPSYGYRKYGKGGKIANLRGKVKNGSKMRMADGGPIYEAEEGEIIQGQPQIEGSQVASDLVEVGGESHEQGGTLGMGGERIFSDRLKISESLKDLLKSKGISSSRKDTYADVSNKIGKLKSKFEDKTGNVGMNTAKVMLPRLEQHLDAVFNDQEMSKTPMLPVRFAKGGRLPIQKFGKAGRLPQLERAKSYTPTFNFGINSPEQLDDYEFDIPNVPVTEKSPSLLDKGLDYLNNNSGQVANAATYLSNIASINGLETESNPQYVANPQYNYTNRSALPYSKNNSLLRTGIKGLTNAGQTVNAGNIGALYAKTLEGNSIIADNENKRKDAYDNDFNQRADQINYLNTRTYNQAQEDSRNARNQRTGLKVGARNSLLQGIMANNQVKQVQELEDKRLLTTLATNDSNGVMTRFLKNYPTYKKLLKTYKSASN